MKKINRIAATLAALCVCTSVTIACNKILPPLSESSAEGEAESSLPESSLESAPPESSAPSTPPVVEIPPPVEEPAPVSKTVEYIKCTGESVNIRAGAGKEFAVLGSAEKGTMYAVTGKSGGWYKTYYRGKTAYISASYASVYTLQKGDEKTEKVLEEGYKLIGVPYVYGAVRFHDGTGKLLSGFTVQKFDCSSLVQYVFYKGAKKPLGVHTRSQVKQGKFVKRSDLARGDCIYFTNEQRQNKVGVERVGHVAIYLGNDYILHTSSDYARIEKMTSKRWSFYIEARRFL